MLRSFFIDGRVVHTAASYRGGPCSIDGSQYGFGGRRRGTGKGFSRSASRFLCQLSVHHLYGLICHLRIVQPPFKAAVSPHS